MKEASSADTPDGRYITSEGWFELNLEDALAVRNAKNGGASYPIEPREYPFEKHGRSPPHPLAERRERALPLRGGAGGLPRVVGRVRTDRRGGRAPAAAVGLLPLSGRHQPRLRRRRGRPVRDPHGRVPGPTSPFTTPSAR